MARFSLGSKLATAGELSSHSKGLAAAMNPEEKLTKLMIMAKESGMKVKDIFAFFDNDDSGDISPDEFREGLEKLDEGRNVMAMTDGQHAELVARFDLDGDGTISMAEFKSWCYNIKALCWKAERVRLEAAGEQVVLNGKAGGSPKTRVDAPTMAPADSSAAGPGLSHVFSTTKLFWRTNEKVDLEIYELAPKDSDSSKDSTSTHPCLIVALFNATKSQNCAPLFLDLHKVTLASDLLAEEARTRQASAKGQSFEEALAEVRKEALGNYVMQRLALDSKGLPIMNKLSGDTFEGVVTVEKPASLSDADVPTVAKHEKVDMDKFDKGRKDLETAQADMAKSSAQARKMTKQLGSSIDTFKAGRKAKATAGAGAGAGRNKYIASALFSLRKKEVEAMQLRLKDSPTYALLLKEQAEKRHKKSTA